MLSCYLSHCHLIPSSHVAQVIRRFRRVCAAVGSMLSFFKGLETQLWLTILDRRIMFVSCSATIAKPKKHMENIFGIDASILLNCPLTRNNNSLGYRISKRSPTMARLQVGKTFSSGIRHM